MTREEPTTESLLEQRRATHSGYFHGVLYDTTSGPYIPMPDPPMPLMWEGDQA